MMNNNRNNSNFPFRNMDIFWNTNFLYGQSIVEGNHQL